MNRSRRTVNYAFASIVTVIAAVGVLGGGSAAHAAPADGHQAPASAVATR
jgi:hypothetical protein